MRTLQHIMGLIAGCALSAVSTPAFAKVISPLIKPAALQADSLTTLTTLIAPRSTMLARAPVIKPMSAAAPKPAATDDVSQCLDLDVMWMDSNIVSYQTSGGTIHYAVYAKTNLLTKDSYVVLPPTDFKQATYQVQGESVAHDIQCTSESTADQNAKERGVLFCPLPDTIDPTKQITVTIESRMFMQPVTCQHSRVLAVKKQDCNTVDPKADGQNCPIKLQETTDYSEMTGLYPLLSSLFADVDQDGTLDVADACPGTADHTDTDGDGTCNALDGDVDGDGFNNDDDNCPTVKNAEQKNADGDSLGDACDDNDVLKDNKDSDTDGVYDQYDNCPEYYTAEPEVDADGDGLGAICDTDGDSTIDDSKGSGITCDAPNTKVGDECVPPAGCDIGWLLNSSGICEPSPVEPRKYCPAGTLLNDSGNCEFSADPAISPEQNVGEGCSLIPVTPHQSSYAVNGVWMILVAAGALLATLRHRRVGPFCGLLAVLLLTHNAAQAATCNAETTKKLTSFRTKYKISAGVNGAAVVALPAIDLPITANSMSITVNGTSIPCADRGNDTYTGAFEAFKHVYVCPISIEQVNTAFTLTANTVEQQGTSFLEPCTLKTTVKATINDLTSPTKCTNGTKEDQMFCNLLAGTLNGILEAAVSDIDRDGVLGLSDNCPSVANVEQDDTDGDGTGDVCEQDNDDDGVISDNDNCSSEKNADQLDTDGDGQGDACDDDDDGDGRKDDADSCSLDSSNTCNDGDDEDDEEEDLCTALEQIAGACTDSDGDGKKDAVDPCPQDSQDRCASTLCGAGEIKNLDGSCSVSKAFDDPLSGGGGCSLLFE